MRWVCTAETTDRFAVEDFIGTLRSKTANKGVGGGAKEDGLAVLDSIQCEKNKRRTTSNESLPEELSKYVCALLKAPCLAPFTNPAS